MKRSIAIINTGIQLINVIEAVNRFGCEDNCLIIGQFNIFPDRIKQIEKMLEDDFMNRHFRKIYRMPVNFSAQNPLRFLGYLIAYIKFAFIIFFSKKFDYCFSGVYTDIIQRPVNYLAYFKNRNICLCLVDEGIRVTEDAKNRLAQSELISRQNSHGTIFFRDFYLAITKRWLPPSLCFFSVYDFPILKRDSVMVNPYLFFKTRNIYRYDFNSDAVVIIGQPYVELKMITEDSYKKTVNLILNSHSNKPCYYVPHPMELLYLSWLPDDVKIVRTQYPIELLLLGAKISALTGFNSSVLFNAAKMGLCDIIQSYVIKQEDYICEYNKVAVDRLYSSFKEVGIEVVNY